MRVTQVQVTDIRKYTSFKAMIEDVGIEQLLPGETCDIDAAVSKYHAFGNQRGLYKDLEKKHGAIAIYIKPLAPIIKWSTHVVTHGVNHALECTSSEAEMGDNDSEDEILKPHVVTHAFDTLGCMSSDDEMGDNDSEDENVVVGDLAYPNSDVETLSTASEAYSISF